MIVANVIAMRSGMRCGLWCIAALVLTMTMHGCDGTPRTRSAERASAPVIELRALTSPAPVALDEGAQPNGVWAQVYAFTRTGGRAVALPPGVLDVLLFDGPLRRSDNDEQEPYLSLRYDSDELVQFSSASVAGIRYALPVRWGEQTPESGIVTLVVRFTPQRGEPVYSSAVSIRIRAR